jgi:hypothetical protein
VSLKQVSLQAARFFPVAHKSVLHALNPFAAMKETGWFFVTMAQHGMARLQITDGVQVPPADVPSLTPAWKLLQARRFGSGQGH